MNWQWWAHVAGINQTYFPLPYFTTQSGYGFAFKLFYN